MSDCCRYPALWLSPEGAATTALGRCRDRLCPLCASLRSLEVARRLTVTTLTWDSIRHVVLTLQSSTAPLREQLDKLQASFRRLRQTKLWKSAVVRGVYSIEVTLNRETGQWHPHLHLLIESSYIPQANLAEQWHQSSGGSSVVWIELVASRQAATRYVAKYVTKPEALEVWSNEQICEYAEAITSRRMIDRFGRRPKTALDAEPDDSVPVDCNHRISARKITQALREQDRKVMSAVSTLARKLPFARAMWGTYLGKEYADNFRPLPPASKRDLQEACKLLITLFPEDEVTPPEEDSPPPPPPRKPPPPEPRLFAGGSWYV